MTEFLDVVNEHDEVIDTVERNDDKREGMIFRMVFDMFYTTDKHVILQLRSKTKKILPGRLTATVSGHVESGASYDDTAIKEAFEETGIEVDQSKLVSLGVHFENGDMRASYVYPFDGTVEDLKVEADEGAGFVSVTIDELRSKQQHDPDTLTPFLLSESCERMIEYIESV